jgi:hypothetical protein
MQALGDSALHLTSQFGGMADAIRCIENLEARPEIDARLHEAAGRFRILCIRISNSNWLCIRLFFRAHPEVPVRCR